MIPRTALVDIGDIIRELTSEILPIVHIDDIDLVGIILTYNDVALSISNTPYTLSRIMRSSGCFKYRTALDESDMEVIAEILLYKTFPSIRNAVKYLGYEKPIIISVKTYVNPTIEDVGSVHALITEDTL